MKTWLLLAALVACPLVAAGQSLTGAVRVEVRDASGTAVTATGTISSDATSVQRTFATDANGLYMATGLPFGPYQITIERAGFAPDMTRVDVRSELPIDHRVVLALAPVQVTVSVSGDSEGGTLLDPFRASAVRYLGAEMLRDRPASSPGRSLIDLVNTQPGWLLEANGVLHARGSEYQVQYVVDGIPMRDNRSPAFAQSLGSEEFQSVTVRTAGYPAEFGGKLGAVIEVATARDDRPGLHGLATFEGGSFATLNGYGSVQHAMPGVTVGIGVERMTTDRYLDPPSEANVTNHGEATGVSGRFERRWTDATRTRAYGYRRTSEFEVPNEALQQEAGQLQERTVRETLGQVAHQQVLSSDTLANLRFMARRTGATLVSNAQSIPIRPSQDRSLREVYASGNVALHRGRHEVKLGGEATFGNLEEQFEARITARRLRGIRIFDGDVPDVVGFADEGTYREQALFAQDFVRLGPVTVQAGLRFDRYRLVEPERALSPRLSASWFVAPASLVLHASYDRAFETPPVENLLLASADVVDELGGEGESLALRSSRGHFVEVGASKGLGPVRLDVNAFSRRATDVADDDLLLNTGVSIPLAFSRAFVRGVEGSLELGGMGPVSGSVNYSYMVGTGWLPFQGGLFLGDDVDELLESDDSFPLTQDQRHTVRARVRGDLSSRVWLGGLVRYDSGLPIEVEGSFNEALLEEQYGEAVVARADLERGRVRPSWSLDLSGGVTLLNQGSRSVRLQADVLNLTDRLNVINFAGLLSGTAVAPRRAAYVRIHVGF